MKYRVKKGLQRHMKTIVLAICFLCNTRAKTMVSFHSHKKLKLVRFVWLKRAKLEFHFMLLVADAAARATDHDDHDKTHEIGFDYCGGAC